jgi:hypothetical protein
MTGLVGESLIRQDLETELAGRLTASTRRDLLEGGQVLRLEDIAQPTDRSKTITVKTLMEFYDLFRKVMEAARIQDGFEHEIRFSKEFPPVEGELPCFTGSLIRREPYSVNGRKELAARFMEEIEDPDFPGDVIERYQRRQTNTVRITVWAKTSKVADELAEWIEDKFYENLWIFQWCGLSHPIIWLGRESDREETVRNQKMYAAPLTFQVITAKITQRRSTALRNVAVRIGLLIDDNIRDRIESDLQNP